MNLFRTETRHVLLRILEVQNGLAVVTRLVVVVAFFLQLPLSFHFTVVSQVIRRSSVNSVHRVRTEARYVLLRVLEVHDFSAVLARPGVVVAFSLELLLVLYFVGMALVICRGSRIRPSYLHLHVRAVGDRVQYLDHVPNRVPCRLLRFEAARFRRLVEVVFVKEEARSTRRDG